MYDKNTTVYKKQGLHIHQFILLQSLNFGGVATAGITEQHLLFDVDAGSNVQLGIFVCQKDLLKPPDRANVIKMPQGHATTEGSMQS